MQIRIRTHSDTMVVQARGALTTEAADELLGEVAKAMAPRACDISLDLGGIDSITAGALPYLFRIRQQAENAQRGLTITAVSQPVLRLLEMTHVSDQLDGVTETPAVTSR